MMEPRSNATIRALASLAELSANQLEEGVSVEEVIATLRKAAEAVRTVVDADDADESLDADTETAGELTVSDADPETGDDREAEPETGSAEITVLNAG